jgi:heme exporter protein A
VRVVAEALGIRLSGRVVFDGLSFDWQGPGIVAVTGPNGAGKTTLMKTLATLLAPGRGTLRHESGGRTLEVREARRQLGFAGPELALYDDLGALENLAFFARARGLAWSAADGRAWLERLGLAGRGEERLATFSSGMKQRIKLAFALQGRPALVLLDEPGSNLDAAGRAQVEALVREAAAEALVVVATNDEAEARWGAARLELAGSR